IAVPDFIHVLNHARVNDFMDRVAPPWVLKPRLMAGAIGIKKVHNRDHFWEIANGLGDEQSYYVLEQFIPGDVLHVDSIVYEREVLFAIASKYGKPPMQVSHEGDVFTTAILEHGTELEGTLLEFNARVLAAMGLVRGVSHTEYIRAHDGGKLYFLETAARVGGAHIADLVEAASGLNLWAEWAKIELAGGAAPYRVAPTRSEYAALLVSLARQEWPDMSNYNDPEICWRMQKKHHAGFIVKSPSLARVDQLLAQYAERVRQDFWAYLPPKERPSD
ncbi:MAG TPA: ATPase, partial [Solibacterales bacterium]|nr:ATPase [Bryobacterales bacterium]